MSNNHDDVIDLDVLRPAKRVIKLGGKIIDVSFIPCGINFEIDALMKELTDAYKEISASNPTVSLEDALTSNPASNRKMFDIGIQICVTFCSHKYPEMTSDWFYENTSSNQILGFVNEIKVSLIQAYKGVGEHSKNAEAAQGTID